ncbi:dihydrodipicolinate synthase family protein [Herbiconiux sp. VKM Ac-2851]|uniref:dihydrodipicolinate synthase family protein n=1 Tax=Herbiconiux sp. VKM Ac-2851 TaxID=2739025 RepID=UPI001566CB9D|nr:dihydrodipicolinate synthase family protein [Herbiconiux sp. VKM Ac-2851]NQX35016.1 dihydrodipicolinate synthase family protein [Herbiconiux sp. VKM Ac-2851]
MTDTLPNGAWPVMLTPFNDDRSIAWDEVDQLTDWLIDNGSAGIFTVALSGEMYDLTEEERLDLARRVVARTAGRVPVIASSVSSGDADEQARSAGAMAATGVDAVVLISSLVAGLDETDAIWEERVQHILDENPGVDFGIYECPLPYKRLPSIELVRWMAESGRFVFYKDTSHSVDTLRARIDVMRGTRLKMYNAQISSLTDSLRAGGAGLSGYAANIHPESVSWLCEHFDDAPADQVLTVQRLLTVAEHVINSRYPSSAKYYLSHSSKLRILPVSRWKPEGIGAHEGAPLVEFARYFDSLGLPNAARVAGAR